MVPTPAGGINTRAIDKLQQQEQLVFAAGVAVSEDAEATGKDVFPHVQQRRVRV